MKRISVFVLALFLIVSLVFGQSTKVLPMMWPAPYKIVSLVPGPVPPNRALNFSFETPDPVDSSLAASWQVFGSKYLRVNAPASIWNQSYMLELTRGAGAVQHIVLNQTEPLPVRMSAYVKGSGILDDPADTVGASLDCKVMYRDGTASFCLRTSSSAISKTKNVGTFDWTWVGYNTMSLSGYKPIEWIDFRLRMGDVPGTAWFDGVHVEEYHPTTSGMVSFVFDDSFLSTYTKAYPIMSASGVVGSVGAVTSYIGGDALHMTLDQHKDLQSRGWTIASHTVTHPDLTAIDGKKVNDELYWSQKYLVDNGLPAKHLMLPFGAYNGFVVARAEAQRYAGYSYLSVRGMDKGINPQGVFPYNIYTQHIESNTTLAEMAAWIADTRERKGWLVLVVHEIDNPNGIYTVDSITFAGIVRMAHHSGLLNVTYDAGFEEITKLQ